MTFEELAAIDFVLSALWWGMDANSTLFSEEHSPLAANAQEGREQ
jgi:hypothetical protein